ncbi:Adhesion G-protein coupled receptor G5 [Saguinus oedipus]|uniref:Adhesion G-protein coupled receptor G5 n=1 Tax=Saguinus oedipus TaxID=9490 RepID=A0ABQ9TKM7_SAGOE|nr:Adhesion G-protein coupled receptor G5 [Saguinus oedipus]
MLLNTSFPGHNLTLQTATIQSLAFKLSCDFSGLSLTSAAVKRVSQARSQHAMQFPSELTRDACKTRPRELRLICIYFSNAHFFKEGVVPVPSWDPLQVSTSLPGLWETSTK